MAKITYPQLIKNIADAYRQGTGSTEQIAISELTSKIYEAISKQSFQFKSIKFNADNTATLTDKDNIQHTMECTYDADGKLTVISLDDRNISITYDGDELKRISYISVDLKNAPTNS